MRYLPDLILLSIVALTHIAAAWSAGIKWPRWRMLIYAAGAGSVVLLAMGFLLRAARVARFFPTWMQGWGRGLILIWAFVSILTLLSVWLASRIPVSAERRGFLRLIKSALLAAPAAATGYGVFIERRSIRVRESDLPIHGLHPDLEGKRIAQLTDIHLSPFLTVPELDYAVQLANETKPMVTVVTGDLITVVRDPLHACLDSLQKLRADAGIYGCLGNHEIYAGAEDEAEREGARRGIVFLRKQQAELRFGGATLNLAGVDYQPFREPYLVGAETLLRPGAANLLMSHNPDVFPVATRQGWNAVVSGHMHGGQIRVEILHADMNLARIFTPFVDGLYRKEYSDRKSTRLNSSH
mgnify:FL=1